jgi:hypothetical protein
LDEICKWATARLVRFETAQFLVILNNLQHDGQWSSITHGLTIAQEIEEFKSRIASVKQIYGMPGEIDDFHYSY